MVDTALDWRWCFFVCVPLAVVSLFVMQFTLQMSTKRRTSRSTTSAPC